ncbi:hypothetical protein CCMSSC00406_0009126 [Pleurotus cornucopiae]|uniref:Uncharacterized protein n=1 Tax=Pleurotus cornucopiae TaxID=5321 RepID=A0ACB7JCN8_PLECO|nr:hypothetical protein CCMSSC00406_0009126 [Pleurotus cornucopiae]
MHVHPAIKPSFNDNDVDSPTPGHTRATTGAAVPLNDPLSLALLIPEIPFAVSNRLDDGCGVTADGAIDLVQGLSLTRIHRRSGTYVAGIPAMSLAFGRRRYVHILQCCTFVSLTSLATTRANKPIASLSTVLSNFDQAGVTMSVAYTRMSPWSCFGLVPDRELSSVALDLAETELEK